MPSISFFFFSLLIHPVGVNVEALNKQRPSWDAPQSFTGQPTTHSSVARTEHSDQDNEARSFIELENKEWSYIGMQHRQLDVYKTEIRGCGGVLQGDGSLQIGMGSIPVELAQVNPHRGWRSADHMRVTASEQVEQSGLEWRRRRTWWQVWRLIWTQESELAHTHTHIHRARPIKHGSSSASFLQAYVHGRLYSPTTELCRRCYNFLSFILSQGLM